MSMGSPMGWEVIQFWEGAFLTSEILPVQMKIQLAAWFQLSGVHGQLTLAPNQANRMRPLHLWKSAHKTAYIKIISFLITPVATVESSSFNVLITIFPQGTF